MAKVYCHTYDFLIDALTEMGVEDTTIPDGVFLWHAVIVVHGVGYSYARNGIETLNADYNDYGDAHEKKYLGKTDLSKEEVEEVVSKLKKKFSAANYHIFDNNCCKFAAAMAEMLDVNPIPKYAREQTESSAIRSIPSYIANMLKSKGSRP